MDNGAAAERRQVGGKLACQPTDVRSSGLLAVALRAAVGKPIRSGRPVTPFNPDPRWPSGYFQVLEEFGVPSRRRPFYAHWIRQFFKRFLTARRRDLGRSQITAYLQQLSDDSAIAEWQIQQAKDALEIYYEQFRGITLDPEKIKILNTEVYQDSDAYQNTPVPHPRKLTEPVFIPPPSEQKKTQQFDISAILKEAQNNLRLEHYALKTEKSYLQWIRRFIHYHNRNPSNMGASEIHHFLSDLAINKNVAPSTQNQALNAIVFLFRNTSSRSRTRYPHGAGIAGACRRENHYDLHTRPE